MITLDKYQLFTEIIILKSPEELSLSQERFKGLYGNVRINFIPSKGTTVIRLYDSIEDKKYGELIRYFLKQDGIFSYNSLQESSYRVSVEHWKRYRHLY